MKNTALNQFSYGSLVAEISSQMTGFETMKVNNLASCAPAIWDVPQSYCDRYCLMGNLKDSKKNEGALKTLRKLPSGTPSKKELTVTINGTSAVWTYGKKGDYWLNGRALMETLETLANNGHNKISIQ